VFSLQIINNARQRKVLMLLIMLISICILLLLLNNGVIFRDLCYLPPTRVELGYGFKPKPFEIRYQRHDWLPGPDVKKFRISDKQFQKLLKSGIPTAIFL